MGCLLWNIYMAQHARGQRVVDPPLKAELVVRAESQLDVDGLIAEMRKLSKEIDLMSGKVTIPDLEQMKNGHPRLGAGPLENEIRRKYARIREIERILDAAEK